MATENGVFLQAAIRYAELGYPVFPCAPGGKAPLTEHGFHDATVDPEQIERWWTQHPNANIGIPTKDLLVIDIDGDGNPWPGDPERSASLAQTGAMGLTPRGGSHRFFRQPAGKHWRCTEGRLAPKVDTRADGGYIVAPPSAVEGGKAYRWAPSLELDEPPERLPEPPPWLAEELDRLANPAPTLAHAAAGGAEANQIPTGHRNATLAKLAGAMRRVGMGQAEIAAACGRGGRILACEPNPLLAETYLPGNLALNGCREQVEICQKVIGGRHQERVDFVLHHGDYATSSLERWAYPHRAEAIQVPMATLDRLCGKWDCLDLVKIDAEGAEALVWEGMQETLKRFPHAAVLVELHLQRDPPQVTSFLHQLERDGHSLCYLNYEGDIATTDAATIIANPHEHWMLWIQR